MSLGHRSRRCPSAGGLPQIYLSLLLLWLGLITGCGYVRVVKVSPRTQAFEAMVEAEDCEASGDLQGAVRSYKKALTFVPDHSRAWAGWVRHGSRADRAEQLELLRAWQDEKPDDPMPHFFEASLRDRSVECFQESWLRNPRPDAPILDPRRFSISGVEDWRQYETVLAALTPRTEALDRVHNATLVELRRTSDAVTQAKRSGAADVTRRLRAQVAWERGEADVVLELLAELGNQDRATLLLRARALSDLERYGEADDTLRWLRSKYGDDAECDLLRAQIAAATGSQSRAVALLRSALPRTLSPIARVDGALLWHRLRPQADAEVIAALNNAVAWAPSNQDLDRLWVASLNRGLLAVARRISNRKADQDTGEGPVVLQARKDLQVLELFGDDKEGLRKYWSFLLRDSALARSQRLAGLGPAEQSRLLGWMLAHPEASYRVQALKQLRQKLVVPFGDLPSELAHDQDPRVRASWIALAARQGGETARRAILAGREDPDEYVRQVAASLRLPKTR